MYNLVINLLSNSNIGSYSKEYIIENNIILKNQSDDYYNKIIKILRKNINGISKEKELMRFLRTN